MSSTVIARPREALLSWTNTTARLQLLFEGPRGFRIVEIQLAHQDAKHVVDEARCVGAPVELSH